MIKPLLTPFRRKQVSKSQRPVTVLVVGQIPPPVNGQSLMISAFLEGKYAELRLIHVPMRFSRSTAEVGSFSFRKLLLLGSTLIHIIVVRLRSGATILYYPPAGANIAPVLRDFVLLIPTRFLFEQTVFHFHAAGLIKIVPRLSKLLRPLFFLAYNYPDLAILTTAATSAEAEHLQARKVAVIPCGVPDQNVSGINPSPNDFATPSILFAGILCEEKGILVLLEACRLLQATDVRFSLTCIGAFKSTMFEKKVRLIIKHSGLEHVVRLPGVVTGNDKTEVFASTDIFCFPSYYPAESFGVVLIEAMSFSLPIVATDWQGIPEVLGRCEDGSNPAGALLVQIQNSVALANALEMLLRSRSKRQAMGMHNRARYLQLFTLDRYRKSLEHELLQLARTKQAASIFRIPMSSMRTVPQKLRSRWEFAIISFVLVLATSFTFLSLAHRVLPFINKTSDARDLHQQKQLVGSSHDQIVSPSPPVSSSGFIEQSESVILSDRITEQAQQTREDVRRRKLLQQFEADTHRRDNLEEYRTRLSHPSGRTHGGVLSELGGASGVSVERDLRAQLATALIRLLTLEKHETDKNPEVISIRKHISNLQVRMVQAAATSQPIMKRSVEHRSSYDAQISQLNTQIVFCDNQITNDLQQLTQLAPPTTLSPARASPVLSTSSTQRSSPVSYDKTTVQPKSTSLSLTPDKNHMFNLTRGQSLTISILLGFLLSITAVLISDRLDRLVRDERALRHIIPDTVEYIGSIPRMKKS